MVKKSVTALHVVCQPLANALDRVFKKSVCNLPAPMRCPPPGSDAFAVIVERHSGANLGRKGPG